MSLETLLEYTTEKSFFLFAWPTYYSDMPIGELNTNKTIKYVDGLLQKMNFTRQPFYEMQDYIKLFEEDHLLADAIRNGFPSLPENYAKCQTAKVQKTKDSSKHSNRLF
jgi:hypothetical protein